MLNGLRNYINKNAKAAYVNKKLKNISNNFFVSNDEAFLDKAVVLAKQNKHREAVSLLNKVINWEHNQTTDMPGDYVESLLKYAIDVRTGSSNNSKIRNHVCDESNNIPPGLLSCDSWLKLSHFSLSNGLFELDPIFRGKAIERAYMDATNDYRNIKKIEKAFVASVDQADFKFAEKLLNSMSGRITNEHLLRYKVFLKICCGDLDDISKLVHYWYSHEDLKYLEIIRNKCIALVGPAPSEVMNGDEIDKYDLIVRISYRGIETTNNNKMFGSRTNMSYYGNVFASAIENSVDRTFFDDLDFAVFKSFQHKFQDEIKELCAVRKFFSPNFCFFNGSAHMIQNALFDLLLFGPAEVKLFNANLFLAKQTHYDGYGNMLNNNYSFNYMKFGGHAHHKCLSSYNFTRNLWRSKTIKVDQGCEDVLSLGEEQYMKNL